MQIWDRQIEKEGVQIEDIQDFDFEKFFEVILKFLRSQKVVESGSTFDCWSRGEFRRLRDNQNWELSDNTLEGA